MRGVSAWSSPLGSPAVTSVLRFAGLAALALCVLRMATTIADEIQAAWLGHASAARLLVILLAVLAAGAAAGRRSPGAKFAGHAIGARASSTDIAWGIANVLLVAACIWTIRAQDITAAGFERSGWPGFGYTAARAVLAIELLAAACVAGALLAGIRRLLDDHEDAASRFVVSGFLGASALALAGTALGLLGWLGIVSAVALLAPLWLVAPRVLRATFGRPTASATGSTTRPEHPSIRLFVHALAAMMAATVFVARGLYPIPLDGDVWEHYLQYYAQVRASGSTLPSEVWYHFFLSKAAGMFHLAIVLTDEFAVQLVSSGFVVLALAALHDLVRRLSDAAWASGAVVIVLSVLVFEQDSGAFFKHHVAFMSLFTFVAWCALRICLDPGIARNLLVPGAIAAFYLALFQPIPALVPTAFLAGGWLWWRFRVPEDRMTRRLFGVMAVSVISGGIAATVMNVLATGMMEMNPVSLFWKLALPSSQTLAASVGGIAFFMQVGNDLQAQRDWSGTWLALVLRYGFFRFLFSREFLALCALAGLAWLGARASGRIPSLPPSTRTLFATATLLLAPALAFAQFAQLSSTYRLYLFMVPFAVGASLLGLRFAILQFVGTRGTAHVSIALLALVCMAAVLKAWDGIEPAQRTIAQQLSGAISLRDALVDSESQRSRGAAIGLSFMEDARRAIAADRRILALGYDPGFYYFLPRPGMVSEPTYALGARHPLLGLGPVDETVRVLRENRIDFLAVDIASPLFSAVAFGPLLDPDEASRRLGVVWRRGDTYLLTWRDDPRTSPLPDALLRALDAKRSGVLHYPFSTELCAGAIEGSITPAHLADLLRAGMRGMNHPANRALVAAYADSLPVALGSGIGTTPARELVSRARSEWLRRIESAFGPGLAATARLQDERQPFGELYADRSAWREIEPGRWLPMPERLGSARPRASRDACAAGAS